MIPIAEAFQPLTSVTLNKRMYSPVMRLDEYSPPIPNDSVYCPYPTWDNQQCTPPSHRPAGAPVSYSTGQTYQSYQSPQLYYPFAQFQQGSLVQTWILILLFGLFALLALIIIFKRFGKIAFE